MFKFRCRFVSKIKARNLKSYSMGIRCYTQCILFFFIKERNTVSCRITPLLFGNLNKKATDEKCIVIP